MRICAPANGQRQQPITRTVLIALAMLAAGCGAAGTPSAGVVPSAAPSPWPSPANYGTIKVAVAVRDDALFHEHDWRRKSRAASLAAQTLLTVRLAAGQCAAYVTELYGNLRDLIDAYAGENWGPLVRTVRGEPSLGDACRQPMRYPAA
jgi:hypothetical protein